MAVKNPVGWQDSHSSIYHMDKYTCNGSSCLNVGRHEGNVAQGFRLKEGRLL